MTMTVGNAADAVKHFAALLAKIETMDDDQQAERMARAFEADGVRGIERVLHEIALEMECWFLTTLHSIDPHLAAKIARRNPGRA
jgi:hypothetical protein